jgi:hypothetical protein
MSMDKRLAIALGVAVWLLGAGAYGLALFSTKPAEAGTSLLYNAPIAFLFLIVLTHMTLQAARLGVSGFVRAHGSTMAVWMVGVAILYLRLVSKNIEVSGHLAWLPLLTAQLWTSRFPTWLVVVGAVATVAAMYMKFFMFRGPSGVPGLIAGVILGAALLIFQTRSREAGNMEG